MDKRRTNTRIYTVVEVMSGVAVQAECFLKVEDARTCLRRLRRKRNLDEDDVQLFESQLTDYS